MSEVFVLMYEHFLFCNASLKFFLLSDVNLQFRLALIVENTICKPLILSCLGVCNKEMIEKAYLL